MLNLSPKITSAGLALAREAAKTPGISVAITAVAIGSQSYTPIGTEGALKLEIARFPVAGGASIDGSQVNLGFTITNTDAQNRSTSSQWIGEIGFYAGATLFAILSKPEPAFFYKSQDIDIPVAYTLDISALPTGSVTVNSTADPAALAAMMASHQASSNPHPGLTDQFAPNMPNYAALRSYAGQSKMVYVSGYLATTAPAGIAGVFVRDDSDTASADNGGTILVALNGVRWKRQFSEKYSAGWFGAKGDGTSSVLAIRKAVAYVSSIGGGEVVLPDGVHLLDAATLISDPSPTVSAYNYWIKAAPNVTISGGRNAVLKVDANVVQSDAAKQYSKGYQIFWAYDIATVEKFALRGFTVDCNGANNLCPVYNAFGSGIQTHVVVSNCARKWCVEDLHVIGTSGSQCIAFYLGSSGLDVLNNRFYDMAGSILGNVNLHDHSTIYIEGDTYRVQGNRFINTNYCTVSTHIEGHGFDGIISNNYGCKGNLGMLRGAMRGDSYNVTNHGNVFDGVTVGVQFDAAPGRRLEALVTDNQFRFRPYAARGTRTMNAVNTGGSFAGRTDANYARIVVDRNVFVADPTATAAGVNFCVGGNVNYLELNRNDAIGFTQILTGGNFPDGATVILKGGYIEGATGALIKHENYGGLATAKNVDYRIESIDLSKSPGLTHFVSCAYDNAYIRNVSITGQFAIPIQPYTGFYNVVFNAFLVDYTTTSMASKNAPPFVTGKIYDIAHRATFFRDNVLDPQRWRIRRQGAAAPTTAFAVGDDHQGDIMENSAPTAGGYLGWLCTLQSGGAGLLGTWKGYGAIAA